MATVDDAPYSPAHPTAAAKIATPEPRTVNLAGAIDFIGFRQACRALWAEQIEPGRVSWHTRDDAERDLFVTAPGSDETGPPLAVPSQAPPVHVPAHFMPVCQSVVLHSDPDRFGLMYRLLWRLQVDPGLRHDALDADWVKAEHMSQAVRRGMHKMKAFVRFRTIAAANEGGEPMHVAWFEPEHHIVEATAPFFVRRFTHMHWAILTPLRSVRWDGRELLAGPGARRDEAPPADAGEALWLTYFRSIFNPARLKLKAMPKEMPRRYWANLPEARLIDPLAAGAARRSMEMIDRDPADPIRRLPVPPAALSAPIMVGSDDPKASLPALNAALQRCRECPIGEHATQAVGGEGPQRARLMFVGEQPGDQEDLHGRPFVGPAGQLLARALAELGIDRNTVYITNAVKHFKFELRGKRRIHKTPAQQETAACLHWLESEITLVDPGALVALGATAARQLMGTTIAVTRQRGQWLARPDGRRVLVTLHPSALLRMEAADKEAAWAAWLDDLRHAVVALSPSSDPPPA